MDTVCIRQNVVRVEKKVVYGVDEGAYAKGLWVGFG